jgi:hypothetical protein
MSQEQGSVISQWVKQVLAFSSEYAGWPATNVVGPSNTYPQYGDLKTAWAPNAKTGTKEFLELQFEKPVLITGIEIYETYNPGAIVKIAAKVNNDWVELYSGASQQATLPQVSRIFSPTLKTGVVSDTIRLDLDTTASQAWSEIDAVKLIGTDPAGTTTTTTTTALGEGFDQEFHKHITTLYETGKYHDVELTHSGKIFKCHRIILSKSLYFKELFEKDLEKKQFVVEYEDEKNVFPMLIDFLYTGKITIQPDSMIAVKTAATFFKIKEVITVVENFLNQSMTKEMVFSLLQTGLSQENKEEDVLVKKSVEYIAKNFASLSDKLKENLSWIPLQVIVNAISHNSFSLADDGLPQFSALLKEVMEKHQVLKSIESIEMLLKALIKSATLKCDTAVAMLKAILEHNATNPDKKVSEELTKECFPVIAGEFDRIDKGQSSFMKRDEFLDLNSQVFSEIMSCDELLSSSEDQVYDFAIAYLERHKDKLSDEEKLAVMHTPRMMFMSLPKLQGIVKEMNDPKGNNVLKLMQNDIMNALCLRVNRSEQPDAVSDASTTTTSKSMQPRSKRMFVHKSDFDTNGILYWIGCNYGSGKYENPVTKGYIAINTTFAFEAGKVDLLVNHTPCSCNFNAAQNTHFVIDFKKVLIMPTKYSIRHTDSRDTECLRNWKLEASKDNVNWVLLKEHKDDQTINGKSSTGSWDIIDPKKEFYRYFKVEQTGQNSANSTYMNLAGMEFYGFVKMLV